MPTESGEDHQEQATGASNATNPGPGEHHVATATATADVDMKPHPTNDRSASPEAHETQPLNSESEGTASEDALLTSAQLQSSTVVHTKDGDILKLYSRKLKEKAPAPHALRRPGDQGKYSDGGTTKAHARRAARSRRSRSGGAVESARHGPSLTRAAGSAVGSHVERSIDAFLAKRIFYFQKRHGKINLAAMRALDLAAIEKTVDIESLQYFLEQLVFGDLELSEDVRDIDPAFLKLFRLSQLSLEYLLSVQDSLAELVDTAYAECRKTEQKLRRSRDRLRERETSITHLKQYIRNKNQALHWYKQHLNASMNPVAKTQQQKSQQHAGNQGDGDRMEVFVSTWEGQRFESFFFRPSDSLWDLQAALLRRLEGTPYVDACKTGRFRYKALDLDRDKSFGDQQVPDQAHILLFPSSTFRADGVPEAKAQATHEECAANAHAGDPAQAASLNGMHVSNERIREQQAEIVRMLAVQQTQLDRQEHQQQEQSMELRRSHQLDSCDLKDEVSALREQISFLQDAIRKSQEAPPPRQPTNGEEERESARALDGEAHEQQAEPRLPIAAEPPTSEAHAETTDAAVPKVDGVVLALKMVGTEQKVDGVSKVAEPTKAPNVPEEQGSGSIVENAGALGEDGGPVQGAPVPERNYESEEEEEELEEMLEWQTDNAPEVFNALCFRVEAQEEHVHDRRLFARQTNDVIKYLGNCETGKHGAEQAEQTIKVHGWVTRLNVPARLSGIASLLHHTEGLMSPDRLRFAAGELLNDVAPSMLPDEAINPDVVQKCAQALGAECLVSVLTLDDHAVEGSKVMLTRHEPHAHDSSPKGGNDAGALHLLCFRDTYYIVAPLQHVQTACMAQLERRPSSITRVEGAEKQLLSAYGDGKAVESEHELLQCILQGQLEWRLGPAMPKDTRTDSADMQSEVSTSESGAQLAEEQTNAEATPDSSSNMHQKDASMREPGERLESKEMDGAPDTLCEANVAREILGEEHRPDGDVNDELDPTQGTTVDTRRGDANTVTHRADTGALVQGKPSTIKDPHVLELAKPGIQEKLRASLDKLGGMIQDLDLRSMSQEEFVDKRKQLEEIKSSLPTWVRERAESIRKEVQKQLHGHHQAV